MNVIRRRQSSFTKKRRNLPQNSFAYPIFRKGSSCYNNFTAKIFCDCQMPVIFRRQLAGKKIMAKTHTFHIPVMGIGFTIDTPLKLAHLGIDSSISLVDDILMEKLRLMYSEKFNLPYTPIPESAEDKRAKRITAYLNMINLLARANFEELKEDILEDYEQTSFFTLLPDNSAIDRKIRLALADPDADMRRSRIDKILRMGSIDVNIMTKIDRPNYRNGVKLPAKYNDAHAALRGYARSDLRSSLVLSAGINPRLYSYLQEFSDFYPDHNGDILKKIVLKVSDYKSALVQGKFLARKGIWVSEYRIESGLNCGGHAFAANGMLLGPVLAEFRESRAELSETLFQIYKTSLAEKGCSAPDAPLPMFLTAQGGVGTHQEHEFLINHYGLDSVGWGTPFLLVPEASTVDSNTLHKLRKAKESDLYLSDISPLGVPFNSLKGNTKDLEKLSKISNGKPGSSCSKRFVALNYDYEEKGLCTASRQYQAIKLRELEAESLPGHEYMEKFNRIVEKSCICVGLGTTSLHVHKIGTGVEGDGVSVCPGPNMAYFSRIMSLKNMTDHICATARTGLIYLLKNSKSTWPSCSASWIRANRKSPYEKKHTCKALLMTLNTALLIMKIW